MWHHDHHDKEVVAQTNPRHSNLSLLRLFSWALPAPGARMWKQKVGWTPTSSSVAHQEVNILQAGFHTLKRADWCHTLKRADWCHTWKELTNTDVTLWKELTNVIPWKELTCHTLKRADWCHTMKRADWCHTMKRADWCHTMKRADWCHFPMLLVLQLHTFLANWWTSNTKR